MDAEAKRLYEESPVEVQRKFDALQGERKRARELANWIEENISAPVVILEMALDMVKEDIAKLEKAATWQQNRR